MNDDLQARIAALNDPVSKILEAFSDRMEEPHIDDNIYMAILKVVENTDPTILKEICPEIVFNQVGTDFYFKIYYHRVH